MSAQDQYSPHASLILISSFVSALNLWPRIRQQVRIPQKTVTHDPHDKLLDVWLMMLTGGHGVVEANTRLRPDRALQSAFGRSACAEQSSLSRTLSACTAETVAQLRTCVTDSLRQHSRACAHDYRRARQLLDVDLTGLPAGATAEDATKGYFASRPSLRGRQLGRVLATAYDEVLVEQLYAGKHQLEQGFQPLVMAAAGVLALDETRRKRTILRVDGGGGSDANLNWALGQGYHVLAKVHNWQRAYRLAGSVRRWYADPKGPPRQVGWVTDPAPYLRPLRQLALRYPNTKPKARTPWHYSVIVTSLADAELFGLCQRPVPARRSARASLLAALHAYDLRDGGLETQNRADKQGLGLASRNKRAFAAQEMLVLLAQLAHNVVIWTRNRLAQDTPRYALFGIQRMVRDVFHIDGCVRRSSTGRLLHVQLNDRHPHAAAVQRAFGLPTDET
jgi:hypothetical protein